MELDLISKFSSDVLEGLAGCPYPLCLGGEPIYAHLESLIDPTWFQNALWDPMLSGNSLGALIEDWNCHPYEAIDEIPP